MKNLLLILAGVASLTTGSVVVNPQDAAYEVREAVAERESRNDDYAQTRAAESTIPIHRRECEIACPVNLYWCKYSPYNYKCDRNGKLQRDRRNEDCEQVTYGCWCGCDWHGPGIEKKDGPDSAMET